MRKFTVSLVLLFVCQAALADNWGHWRGPTGNGAATDASPPTEWSEKKNIKWKVAIPGKGSGSPVIWGDKVFVVTAVSTAAGSNSRQAGREPSRRPGGSWAAGRRPAGGRRAGAGAGPEGLAEEAVAERGQLSISRSSVLTVKPVRLSGSNPPPRRSRTKELIRPMDSPRALPAPTGNMSMLTSAPAGCTATRSPGS